MSSSKEKYLCVCKDEVIVSIPVKVTVLIYYIIII